MMELCVMQLLEFRTIFVTSRILKEQYYTIELRVQFITES